MKTVCSIVKIIETVMKVIVAVFATVIILFAAYSLYDTFYINQHAFSSYELKQFKPVPKDNDEGKKDDNSGGNSSDDGQDSLKKLKEINEDARAWISIYDTHIDYPVVQGKDDLEYASKDIYGNTSITGAIYLKTDNSEDLSDVYNVVFGHHMDNGAMFGDLEKYKNKDYFDSHLEGWLYAGGRYYRLDVFSVMLTDAYNEKVYNIKALKIRDRVDYILNNSEHFRPLSDSDRESLELFEKEGPSVLDKLQKSGDPALVIALSTCESAITNGRIVVFCKATPVDYKDIPQFNKDSNEDPDNKDKDKEPDVIKRLTAIGHPFGSDRWAFLNLICVVYCLVVVLPFAKTGIKYKQSKAAKKVDNLYNGYGYDGSDAMAIVRYGNEIKAKLQRYRRRMSLGSVLEILSFVIAIIVFFLTEDMTTPVVMCDEYTPVMIAICVIMFIVDAAFFVYRDTRIHTPDEVAQMSKPDGSNNGN